jgi:adenine-specific DNA methylase
MIGKVLLEESLLGENMSSLESDKRFIEVDFPIKEVSEESVREKNIRYGHISTLHIWWARRPLAASRATTYASLIPAPKDEKELKEKLKFIAELSRWENSLNLKLIEKARKEIREFFGGKAPKVLDCFAGGGSIPLEALRLGCETYASDYNPVAVLILKAVLEYPQKYGKKLIEDVKKWGKWVYEEAKKEIGRFYPDEIVRVQNSLSEGGVEKYIPVGYIWARTVKCKNPSCGAEIPLIKHLWLVRRENKKIAIKLIVDKVNKKVDFKIVQGEEIDFNPSKGTIKNGSAQCPICGAVLSKKEIWRLFQEGKSSQRMIAVVSYIKNKGKIYRVATDNDFKAFVEAEKYLEEKRSMLMKEYGYDPIPNELLPDKGTLGISPYWSAPKKWGDLFNSRQKLALITFVEKIKKAYEKMISERYDEEYAKAIMTYLAFAVDWMANKYSTLAFYDTAHETITQTYNMQTLPMSWDYMEINPFNPTTGGVVNYFQFQLKLIDVISKIPSNKSIIACSSATSLSYPDNYFDAVITDPPYYDNVPYSYLSDFFYVWLKRTIGDLYQDLFVTPLTPKSEEIVAYRHGKDGFEKGKKFFEEMITKAFQEINRILKPEGIACIVFAYKTTEAWETIINSLLKSGLVITASWPIHTEMKKRLRAQESAALASSIYMICRKRTKNEVAYFNDIKEKIEQRIKEKLIQFWEQGISGADFFISAIGPAVEVFGQYSRIEKLSGEEVSTKELLEYIRKVVSEFALKRVLKRADLGGVDVQTRFYLLWRWTFKNSKVHFDDAIKLSRSLGVELTELWDKGGLVKKEKEFIMVLGPKERARDKAFINKTKLTSMIDVLHYVLVLWERGEREKIKEILNETGYARNEVFWQVAQALSEILPEGDKEKQLIQGFLYGKEEYIRGTYKRKTLSEFVGDKL